MSEFSDQHIIVTSGPLAGTMWQTSFAPYQRGILDAFHEVGVETVVVMGSSQWGKALALDTPIPTPDGWSTMGVLHVGDRVFDERGRVCRVTFVTAVMHDRPCYRVRFSDKTEIIADAEHQWYVESDTPLEKGTSWRGPGPRRGVLTTAHIEKTWQRYASHGRPRNRYAIPVAKPLELARRQLPVDPYVLGMWLGDGTLNKGAEFTLNSLDVDEILASFAEAGVDAHEVARVGGAVTVRADQRLAQALRRLTIRPKAIPSAYLRGSIEQRRALLQGLMDADGAIDANGDSCEFATTSPGIADTFDDLLLSLGVKHTVHDFIPMLHYKGRDVACAKTWRYDFTAYVDAEIFRVSRKRRRLPTREGRRTTETERRRIVGVDAVPSVPVKCITVDSENHLYLAGRAMVPTHNTACAVNVVAYHIAHEPCPILVIEPTVEPMAKDFARNRLEPVIAATPILEEKVSKRRAKDSTNTTLQKTYRGGAITIGGANSASSLASRSIRLLILDEVDRYPPELPGEGSTLAIVIKRTQAYRRRRRILMLSSPTLDGAPIHSYFNRGDQRRYYVPCPSCRHMHPFEWKNIKWTDHDASTTRIHCPACDYGLTDAERVAVLSDGEWRAENSGRRDKAIVSFHMWEAYSPLSSLHEIVTSFLAAREKQKTGDKSEMHTWQNTTLGEPVTPDKGDGVESHTLLLRREPRELSVDVPAGACCLTMGVDVQDDRLEALIVGWGPGEESWMIDRHTLPGDTSQAEPWQLLDELLDRPYEHASGQHLHIQATCIDSAGHRTTMVYDYAERKATRRVYAIIGRDGQRPIVSSPSPKRWGRQERQVPLYTIGVDSAKSLFVSRLALTEKGGGFVHLPHADWCDDEFAAQLTSERLVMKWHKGVPQQIWKKIRPRNEALDCAVYALGALRLLNPKLSVMAAALAAAPPTTPSGPTGGPSPTARRVSRSSYLQR